MINDLLSILYALGLTLIIELPIYYLIIKKREYSSLLTYLVMNIITNVSLNLFNLLIIGNNKDLSYLIYILELVVLIIETIIIFIFIYKCKLNKLFISFFSVFIANSLSFFLGQVINYLLEGIYYIYLPLIDLIIYLILIIELSLFIYLIYRKKKE